MKSGLPSVMRIKTAKRKRGAAATAVATDVEVDVATQAAASAADAGADAPAARTVVLSSICNVKDAAALKQALCDHLEECDTVTLDIRRVERVDTSTMQLLCAFTRDRSAQQRQVEWLGDAAVIREAARLIGVEALLALPQAETETARNNPQAPA